MTIIDVFGLTSRAERAERNAALLRKHIDELNQRIAALEANTDAWKRTVDYTPARGDLSEKMIVLQTADGGQMFDLAWYCHDTNDWNTATDNYSAHEVTHWMHVKLPEVE